MSGSLAVRAVATSICLLGSVTLPVAMNASASPVPASASVPQANRLSGVDLQTFNDTNMSPNFGRVSSDGANMVNITVWWQVPSFSSNVIAPGTMTLSDVNLIQMVQNAEAAGLQVALTPDFVVGKNSWRGQYDPPDPTTFFTNYAQMLDHYAVIAKQFHMPMFWVGSEMIDSEKYTSQWYSTIASVRQNYPGKLLYDVNWSTTANVLFYGALDAVSLSAYYPLSDDADPSLNQLMAAWHGANPDHTDWFAAVAALEQRWQKPIYFGEAGYSFSTYAAEAPATETYSRSDPDLQYRCYQALDDTFRGQSWWGGVLWWAWDGGVYNMDGEPAEALIGTKSVAYPTPPAGPALSSGAPAEFHAPAGGPATATSGRHAVGSVTRTSTGSGLVAGSSSGSGAVRVPVSGVARSAAAVKSNPAPGTAAPSRTAAAADQHVESSPTRVQAATRAGRQGSIYRAAFAAAVLILIALTTWFAYAVRNRTLFGRVSLRRRATSS